MASEKKVALVTGAGTGIGRAAALALHRNDHEVVLAGRRQELLEETASLADPTGRKMLVVAADIVVPEQVSALFAETRGKFGRLDVLFNNAGIGAPREAARVCSCAGSRRPARRWTSPT